MFDTQIGVSALPVRDVHYSEQQRVKARIGRPSGVYVVCLKYKSQVLMQLDLVRTVEVHG